MYQVNQPLDKRYSILNHLLCWFIFIGFFFVSLKAPNDWKPILYFTEIVFVFIMIHDGLKIFTNIITPKVLIEYSSNNNNDWVCCVFCFTKSPYSYPILNIPIN